MKNGFTLVELLSVIIIIGFLILIGGVTLVNRILDQKEIASEAGDTLIIEASNQFMSDNRSSYLSNHDYCIKIKTLIDSGYLSSPVVDVSSGKNIEDRVVFVHVDSNGFSNHKIMKKGECREDS